MNQVTIVDRVLRVRSPERQARIRLLCLPYAGAGATVFHTWNEEIAEGLEVCSVQLPGRQDRLHEPALSTMQDVVHHVASTLRRLAPLPLLIYGHSFGAVTAYELAKLLESEQYPVLACIVGACGAPHRLERRTSNQPLSDEEFIQTMQQRYGTPPALREAPDLMQLVLPAFRSDMAILDRYQPVLLPPAMEPSKLQIPIRVLYGRGDDSMTLSAVAAWNNLTVGSAWIASIDAGHFFVDSHRAWVHDQLRMAIAALRPHARLASMRPAVATRAS